MTSGLDCSSAGPALCSRLEAKLPQDACAQPLTSPCPPQSALLQADQSRQTWEVLGLTPAKAGLVLGCPQFLNPLWAGLTCFPGVGHPQAGHPCGFLCSSLP